MKLKFVCFLGVIIWSGGMFAQEGEPEQSQAMSFDLESAQTYAVQHNKTLMNASRDVQLAEEKLKETTGAGLPQVSGTFDYMTYFNYEFELNFGGGSTEPPDINWAILDAGDLEIVNYLAESMSSSGSTIIMSDQASANLQVSQLVFSGQYWVGREMARIGKKMAESNLVMTELDIRETVINTYYVAIVTNKLLEILESNKANLEEVQKHTNDMYLAGMAELTDVDQIRISVSQLDNSIKTMERNRELNMNMFRFILGIDGGQKIELTDQLEGLIASLDPSGTSGLQFNLLDNPTYRLLEDQETLSRKSVDMQKWAYAPTIAAFYSYKEKILTTAFDLSPKHAAGLSVNVPIFAGGTKQAQVSQARIELDKASRTLSMVEEQLELQDKQLRFELNSAWDNYTTQKENVDVAKRVYNSTYNKYKQGMVSSLDLTMANNNYLMAESNFISSMLSLLQSDMKLDKLYNKL